MMKYLNAKTFAIFLSLMTIFTSCDFKQTKEATQQSDKKERVLSSDNLAAQKFTINAESDTIIKGKTGSIFRIYKNTFVDNSGNPAIGKIDIELKEALLPADIILSGLTTTSNGQFLETGGMIYLNATASGQQVEIASNKSIGVILPNGKIKKGMKLFEGESDSSGINWKNPGQILNSKLIAKDSIQKQDERSSATVILQDISTSEIVAISDNVEQDISKSNNPNNIRKKKKRVEQAKGEKGEDDIFINEIINSKGINWYQQDYNSNYIFSLKKLGWANIDRLYQDARTREIEFVTNIENEKDFETIYITLIISNKSMYIPGYQRKDDTFSFTHNDEEPTWLPVGETATILATAYRNGIPYYAVKKITIVEKQKVIIKLEETTNDKLKETLNKQI